MCRASEIGRSEEHTSELQSHSHLVCRLLLEKKRASDRKSTSLNSSHTLISYAVFCLKKKNSGGRWKSERAARGLGGGCAPHTRAVPPRTWVSLPASISRGVRRPRRRVFFFFNETATPEIYPLSLPDPLPI